MNKQKKNLKELTEMLSMLKNIDRDEQLDANDLAFINSEISLCKTTFKVILVILLLISILALWLFSMYFQIITSIMLSIPFFAFCILICWVVKKIQRRLELDLENGFKEFSKDVITKKDYTNELRYFYINKEKHFVSKEDYDDFEVGETIIIGFLPISKTIIGIAKII